MMRFFWRSVLLTIFYLIAGAAVFTWLIPTAFTWSLLFLLLFVLVVTNIVYAWLFTSFGKNNRRFTSGYLAVNVLKMFLYLIVVIGWAWFERENARVLLAGFLIMYIGYSVLEVVELMKLVKKK